MKTLRTTLGLFLLSLFLFSFTPQQVTAEDTTTVEQQIQLEEVYDAGETIKEDEKRRGDE